MSSPRAYSHIILRGGEEEEGSGKLEGQGCGQDMDVDRRDDEAEKLRRGGWER